MANGLRHDPIKGVCPRVDGSREAAIGLKRGDTARSVNQEGGDRDSSSPSEGSAKPQHVWALAFRSTCYAATPAACGCWRRWPKTPAGATSALPSGPGTWTGFRPPAGPGGACRIPGTGGLQAPRPHRGTGVRAAQDLPETDHDGPPRPGRVRKRMAARLRGAQPAQTTPAPYRALTIKGPPPAARTQDRPTTVAQHPDLHSTVPICLPRRVCATG
jgi:hypothetical protein